MGLAHSPKVVTDGLVFYYDMNNPEKSWRGAPTVNLQLPNIIDWSNSAAVSLSTSEVSPIGTPVYSVTDNNTGSYLACARSITVPNNSNTYTISIYIKKTYGETSARLGFNSGFSGGTTGVALNQRFNSDTGVGTGSSDDEGDWWRWKFSLTNNSTGNTTLYCTFYPATGFYNSGDNATATGTALVSAVQIEQNAFATPFVNGTRSNTQAVLDLTNNNTVTATSLTYATDGTFSFNGSGNHIDAGTGGVLTLGNNGAFSVGAWIRCTTLKNFSAILSKVVASRGGTYSFMACMHNDGRLTFYNNASWFYSTNVGLTTNTWYYVNFVYNGSGTLSYYVNGTAAGTSSLTWPENTAHKVFIGSWYSVNNSYDFVGTISTSQLYNRALTAEEVQQNFNALRGRYGI